MTDFFLGADRGRTKETYFVYEARTYDMRVQETMVIDACEVYTGPAAALPQPNDFKDCITDDGTTQCNIPQFVWSGRLEFHFECAHYSPSVSR